MSNPRDVLGGTRQFIRYDYDYDYDYYVYSTSQHQPRGYASAKTIRRHMSEVRRTRTQGK